MTPPSREPVPAAEGDLADAAVGTLVVLRRYRGLIERVAAAAGPRTIEETLPTATLRLIHAALGMVALERRLEAGLAALAEPNAERTDPACAPEAGRRADLLR